MKKRAKLFVFILLALSFSLWAQDAEPNSMPDTKPNAMQEAKKDAEPDPKPAEQASSLPEEQAIGGEGIAQADEDQSDDDGLEELPVDEENENDGNDSAKGMTRREKIKTLYKEYKEKSTQVHEQQRISGSQMVADFITDKLPLTLDLGAEPSESGSKLFATLQYDWNERYASRLYLSYQTAKRELNTDSQFSIMNNGSLMLGNARATSLTKEQQFETDLYPFLHYFGDDDRKAKTPFCYFGLGFFYLFYWNNITTYEWAETATQKILLNYHSNTQFHQFGPIAIGSIQFPFFKHFGIELEASFSPINRVVSSSTASASGYIINTELNTGDVGYNTNDTSNSQWCSPQLKLDLAVEAFTYFRLRTRFTYRRVYLGSLTDVNFISFYTDENRQEDFMLRYGMEIVFPSSNRTRKKKSHLWAGVYYEHEWNVITEDKGDSSNHLGKWVFCFGT